jgi:hypothetical protein
MRIMLPEECSLSRIDNITIDVVSRGYRMKYRDRQLRVLGAAS